MLARCLSFSLIDCLEFKVFSSQCHLVSFRRGVILIDLTPSLGLRVGDLKEGVTEYVEWFMFKSIA